MAVAATDFEWYLSGGAANTAATASTGGAISGTQITNNVLHNIFDKVNGDQSAAGYTDYRVIYVKNAHASQSAERVFVYFEDNHDIGGSADPDIAMGLNSTESNGNTAAHNPTGTDEAKSQAAPSNVSWSFADAAADADALNIGTLSADQARAIYLRRIIPAGSTAADEATFELTLQADTGE